MDSALSGLGANIVEVLEHLNFHQLQQLFFALVIEVMVSTELIHNLSHLLLIARVELYLIYLRPHVDVYY